MMSMYQVRRLNQPSEDSPILVQAISAEQAAATVCRTRVLSRGARACAEVYPIDGGPCDLVTLLFRASARTSLNENT